MLPQIIILATVVVVGILVGITILKNTKNK